MAGFRKVVDIALRKRIAKLLRSAGINQNVDTGGKHLYRLGDGSQMLRTKECLGRGRGFVKPTHRDAVGAQVFSYCKQGFPRLRCFGIGIAGMRSTEDEFTAWSF